MGVGGEHAAEGPRLGGADTRGRGRTRQLSKEARGQSLENPDGSP